MSESMDVDFDNILTRVRRIVAARLGRYEVRVYLFGSRATGVAHEASDIDLAVDPREPLPAGTLADLREALEESSIPFRVDIVDLRDTDAKFRDSVREKGVEWNVSASA